MEKAKILFYGGVCWVLLSLIFVVHAGVKEDFFQAGLGAKSAALGGTAFAFGSDSLFSNPAGLAVTPEKEFSCGYKSNFDGLVDTQHLSYAQPWQRGAWGVGLVYLNNVGADKTVVNEFDRPEVIGSFGENQTGLSLAYAHPVFGDSAVGLGLRYYQDILDEERASAYGLFAGYIKKINKNLLVGLSVNNIALTQSLRSEITWSTGHVDYFPLRCSLSSIFLTNFLSNQTEFVGDVHFAEVNEQHEMATFYSLGALMWLAPQVFNIRCGFADESITVGAGLRAFGFGLDYAFISHRTLGPSHLLSTRLEIG